MQHRLERKIIWCLSLLVNVYRWTVVTPNIRDLVLNKLQNEMKFTPDFGFKITHADELYERNNENRWLLYTADLIKETSNDMIGYSQVYLHAIRLKFQTVNATVLVKSWIPLHFVSE